jgi:hypothetical protein
MSFRGGGSDLLILQCTMTRIHPYVHTVPTKSASAHAGMTKVKLSSDWVSYQIDAPSFLEAAEDHF